ncbi:hypothetical protein GCK32_021513 [Trichostrongylus colubriformis]|uniref:Uncharacterized protein n=1 Tax=Trichostrongylus colubriformis TaxID=6319 RepID=A0AAN8EZ75_TRICO
MITTSFLVFLRLDSSSFIIIH